MEDQPSTSKRTTGVGTRQSRRLAEMQARQEAGSHTPGALTSPSMTLDCFYANNAPRKAARLSSRPAKSESFRVIRQKGHSGQKPHMTGLFGSIPSEVSRWTRDNRAQSCPLYAYKQDKHHLVYA